MIPAILISLSVAMACGGAAGAVVLADRPEPTSVLAAEELTNYLAKAGVDASALGEIRIGVLANYPGEVPAAAKAALTKAMKPDAYWIGYGKDGLVIAGRDRSGELYGVYRFLESKIGVRWFKGATKEDPGEYVPRLGKLALEPFTEFREPDFRFRMLHEVCSRTGVPGGSGAACAIRNGLQFLPPKYPYEAKKRGDAFHRWFDARIYPGYRNSGGGHNLFLDALRRAFGKQDVFALHPEYFALVDGKRVKGHMYCMSNPEVQQIVADYLVAADLANEGMGFGVLELADYFTGNCECPECRKLDGPGGLKAGRTHRFLNVMKQVKARVRKVRPDMKFLSYAYQNYRTLPPDVEVDRDEILLYCTHGRSMVNVLDDPRHPENLRLFKEALAWRAKTDCVVMREYMTCSHLTYCPVERLFAKDLKLYRRSGFDGWWEEMVFSDSPLAGSFRGKHETEDRAFSCWQYYYVAGKLLWDSSLDVEAVLDDVESKYYGPAYPAMKKYQKLRRDVWDASRGGFGYPFPDARTPTLLGIGDTKDRLFAYLDEAEKLADGVYLHRIRQDRLFLERYWVAAYEKAKAFAGCGLKCPSKTEAGWNGAFYADEFVRMVRGHTPAKELKTPPELATSVGFMSDDDNLYFRLIAKEPNTAALGKLTTEKDGPVWGEDGFELFIYPPSVENTYAHVAVNPAGGIYDARCPGMDKSVDYGVTTDCRIEKDRYTIDVKVPLKLLTPIRPGDVWKVVVARRRTIKDAYDEKGDMVWSLFGAKKHDTSSMLSLEMGSANLVKNGSFEEGQTFWGRPIIVETESGHAMKIVPGQVISGYFHNGQKEDRSAKKFRYSFRMKGRGRLAVHLGAIRDTVDYKAKHGYTRETPPSKTLGNFEATDEWRTFSGTMETLENVQSCIRFLAASRDAEVLVDDVVVVEDGR